MKNLENYGVQDLELSELKNIDGGSDEIMDFFFNSGRMAGRAVANFFFNRTILPI